MQSVEVTSLALPYHYYSPTQLFEFGVGRSVAGDVTFEFRLPEIDLGLGGGRAAAVLVSMPKAAVDEYGTFEPREHHVRSARQPTIVQDVAKTCTVQISTHHELGRRVFSSDARHQKTSSQAALVFLRHLKIYPRLFSTISVGGTSNSAASLESMGILP
jgi:hypothetical protein